MLFFVSTFTVCIFSFFPEREEKNMAITNSTYDFFIDNEQERNLNNKYQLYIFLQIFAGLSKSIPLTFDPDSLFIMDSIRRRIFSRIILKRLVEDLHKEPLQLIDSIMKNPILDKFSYKPNEKIVYKSFHELNWQEYINLLDSQDLIKRFLGRKQDIIKENKDMMKQIAKLKAQKENNAFIENNLISFVNILFFR